MIEKPATPRIGETCADYRESPAQHYGDIRRGTVEISRGNYGEETMRSKVDAFVLGDFAAHVTAVHKQYWTATHAPTGLSVAREIDGPFNAIECIREAHAAAQEVGLDTTIKTWTELRAHPSWNEFAKHGLALREKYGDGPANGQSFQENDRG